MFNHLYLSGASGNVYEFRLYRLPHTFKEHKGAVFLFVRFITRYLHVPLEIGVTKDLQEYFSVQSAWHNREHGEPTHVGVYVEDDEDKRQYAVNDLTRFA